MENWPFQATHSTLVSSGKLLVWRRARPPSLWNPANHELVETEQPDYITMDDLFCAGHSTLADGRVLAVGGTVVSNNIGSKESHIFDPATETSTRAADMTYGRWYPTITTLHDGRVLAMSGDISKTVRADIPEIYDPVLDTWTALPAAEIALENYPRNFVLPDGRVFYVGDNQRQSKVLDIETQTWVDIDRTIDPKDARAASAAM